LMDEIDRRECRAREVPRFGWSSPIVVGLSFAIRALLGT
jgi:hypothetical protein